MAVGISNSLIGYVWARRLLWIYLGWMAFQLLFLRHFFTMKLFGVNGFLSVWVYAPLAIVYAIDIYRRAI